MAEQRPSDQTSPQGIPGLRELAALLRSAHHLEPDAQQELADLVDELRTALDTATLPSDQSAHLSETTAHLVESLHQRRDRRITTAAKERLEEAAARAETVAPVATGVVRRIIDVLADMGI